MERGKAEEVTRERSVNVLSDLFMLSSCVSMRDSLCVPVCERVCMCICACTCVCVCKLLEFVEIVTSIKFHSILKEFSTDDAQVISEIGYCVPTANKYASVWTCVCVCLVPHECVCVYICIKSNFNCAYLSLGKYLQRVCRL